ncbi:vacuolar calcium ion transporter [Kluyveromyces marxianus]|nr:vacuolar calcium ion transporter [Kluyveromyces marxianus]
MNEAEELKSLASGLSEASIIQRPHLEDDKEEIDPNDNDNGKHHITISPTNTTGNCVPSRRSPMRTLTTPGKYQQELALPERYLERKPTVEVEAKGFYYFVSFMKQLRITLFDGTLNKLDAFYTNMWSWPVFRNMMTFYQEHKDTKGLGTCLQVLRCCVETRTLVFLFLFPAGIVCYKQDKDVGSVICNLLALMYFAKLLSNATEYASEHFGPVFGALLNATFGNLVELVISGTTVSKDDAVLTITSLIGSVLSNNMLVCGTCFFFGGLDGMQMHAKNAIANHMLFLSCITLALSLTSVIAVIDSGKSLKFKENTSQIGATLIFVCYIVYLIASANQEFKTLSNEKSKEEERLLADTESSASDSQLQSLHTAEPGEEEEEEEETKNLPPKLVCFITLAIATAGLGPTGNFFVESLKRLTDDKPISKVFIGLIVLPLAGSLPEHISSLIAAYHGGMDLSVSLAVGSSNQILGMVLPIIQFISSRYPKTGFTLYFEPYVAGYLFVSTFVCCFTLIHGLLFSVNVLHGTLLLVTYGIIVYLTFAN